MKLAKQRKKDGHKYSSSHELYMEKKISYDFLQGIQLPLQIKKRLLDIDNEETRMGFINKMFQNVLDGEISSNNIPEA